MTLREILNESKIIKCHNLDKSWLNIIIIRDQGTKRKCLVVVTNHRVIMVGNLQLTAEECAGRRQKPGSGAWNSEQRKLSALC